MSAHCPPYPQQVQSHAFLAACRVLLCCLLVTRPRSHAFRVVAGFCDDQTITLPAHFHAATLVCTHRGKAMSRRGTYKWAARQHMCDVCYASALAMPFCSKRFWLCNERMCTASMVAAGRLVARLWLCSQYACLGVFAVVRAMMSHPRAQPRAATAPQCHHQLRRMSNAQVTPGERGHTASLTAETVVCCAQCVLVIKLEQPRTRGERATGKGHVLTNMFSHMHTQEHTCAYSDTRPNSDGQTTV